MNRAGTHPGLGPESSGSFLPPRDEHRARDLAADTIANPIFRLLAGLLAALALAYISLKVSTIDGRLDAQDAINGVQSEQIQGLIVWRARVEAREDTTSTYKAFLEVQTSQGKEFMTLIRDIRDRLPPR